LVGKSFKPTPVAQPRFMSRSGRSDDLSVLLYLVPFIVSGVYGLALWVQAGVSVQLPSSVYLTVTRDPIVFAIGTLAVLGGVVLEVNSAERPSRPAKLSSIGNTLQSIAAASLVLVLVSAIYANGTDVGGAATDFIVGRYGLVFPVMMVVLSYLITAQFSLRSLGAPKPLGIVALMLVPVALYEVGKRNTAAGLVVSLVLIVFGIYMFVRRDATSKAEKQ